MRGGRGRNCRKDTAGWHVPQDDKFRYLLRRYEGNLYTWISYLIRGIYYFTLYLHSYYEGIIFVHSAQPI